MLRLRNLLFIAGGVALLAAATESVRRNAAEFEPEPRVLFQGRSPKFQIRKAQDLQMLSVRPAPDGSGQNIFFQSSDDGGDSFTEPVQVNDALGEVTDHGENSPQLLIAADGRSYYVVWNSRDPKNPSSGGRVRLSARSSMRGAWTPAITAGTGSFQSAAAAPDGSIYIAWLGRDRPRTADRSPGHHPPAAGEEGSALFVTRSSDGGATFRAPVRVAANVCPCCRPDFGFAAGQVAVAWRCVESGDLRDIFTVVSGDAGATWSDPRLVARDGWKINGCPHVGPSLAALGSKLYITWFSEAGGKPGIYMAASSDGGRTFSNRQKISEGTFDTTHPQMAAAADRLAVVFQARAQKSAAGWGRVGVYYREIYPDGTSSQLVRAGEGKANASYPFATLGPSGRIYIGWTQTSDGVSSGLMLRGRNTAANSE